MDFTYRSAPNGNVVQTAETALTGKPGGQSLTLALGFARGSTRDAWGVARAALDGGFAQDYDVSVMTLAASEDMT